jgi:hypothetical protein
MDEKISVSISLQTLARNACPSGEHPQSSLVIPVTHLYIYPDVALKRQLGVLPNLYQAVLYYVLWVTCDIT